MHFLTGSETAQENASWGGDEKTIEAKGVLKD